jgi:hypothetical protein
MAFLVLGFVIFYDAISAIIISLNKFYKYSSPHCQLSPFPLSSSCHDSIFVINAFLLLAAIIKLLTIAFLLIFDVFNIRILLFYLITYSIISMRELDMDMANLLYHNHPQIS